MKRLVARGAAVVLTILTVAAASAPPAGAAARTVDDACVFAAPSTFSDRGQGEVAVAIDCVAHYRIALGVTETRYDRAGLVRRDQMASFLVRLIEVSNGAVSPTPSDHFPDDAGNIHEQNINRLFETGITVGAPDGTYRPADFVTRDQMASFIARAIEYISGVPLAAASADHFDDDGGNVHESRINQLADIGIVQGTAPRQYDPRLGVTRGQMAFFLARTLDFLTEVRAVPLRRINEPDATSAPELLSAVRAGGQTIRFTFDEALNEGALVPSRFRAHSFDAATSLAETADLDPDEPAAVLARFSDSTRLDLVTAVSAGRGAAQDVGGALSIEASAPLGSIQLPPGITDAPDLVAASAVGSNNTLFNFHFDEPAFRLRSDGYHLVLLDGTTITATGSTGEGTTTHTASFAVFDPSRVVRTYVEAATVSDTPQETQPPARARGGRGCRERPASGAVHQRWPSHREA